MHRIATPELRSFWIVKSLFLTNRFERAACADEHESGGDPAGAANELDPVVWKWALVTC